jgi:hypothetical protein
MLCSNSLSPLKSPISDSSCSLSRTRRTFCYMSCLILVYRIYYLLNYRTRVYGCAVFASSLGAYLGMGTFLRIPDISFRYI